MPEGATGLVYTFASDCTFGNDLISIRVYKGNFLIELDSNDVRNYQTDLVPLLEDSKKEVVDKKDEEEEEEPAPRKKKPVVEDDEDLEEG